VYLLKRHRDQSEDPSISSILVMTALLKISR